MTTLCMADARSHADGQTPLCGWPDRRASVRARWCPSGSLRGLFLAVGLILSATLVALPTPGLAKAQLAATLQVAVYAAPPATGIADSGATTTMAPIAGATVAVHGAGAAVTTDARGVAVLRGLAPGRHRLVISAFGFVEATTEVDAVNGRVVRARVLLEAAPLRLDELSVRSSRETSATIIETETLPPGVGDLPAVLERVPGATIVRRGGVGAVATVQLRGAESDQILVLLDGVPINSPLTGVADLSVIDLASIARITVIPGAQSARYGPRALGGVVLLESQADEERRGRLTVGAGAWSATEAALTAATGIARDWSLSGGAHWRRSDGAFAYDAPAFRGGGRRERENAAFRQVGGDLRVARRGWVAGSLRAHLSDVERGSPGTIAQPSLSGRQRHRLRGMGGRVEVGDDGSGIALNGATQWQRAEYADPSPPFGRAYDTRTRARRAEYGVEGWWRSSGSSLGAGLHGVRTNLRSNALAPSRVRVGQVGAWARGAESWRLPGAVRVDLAAAIRADRHDLVAGTTLSPGVDLTLARPGIGLEIGWRRGFSPPGLGDLFFQEGVLVEPNPNLRPERVRGEFSVAATATLALGSVAGELRGAAYRADLDDMILWFPDHRFVWSPDNYNVLRRGLEISARAELSHSGATHALTANAHWSRVEYTGATLAGQVAYHPRFTADVALTIALPAGVTLAPSALHLGERRSIPGSALNALDRYTLVDLALGIPLALGLIPGRIDLTLSNLFDEGAALLVDYPLPGRGWSIRLRLPR